MSERRVMIDALFAITFDRPPEYDGDLVALITHQLAQRLPGILADVEVDPASIHTFIAGPGSPEDDAIVVKY